MDFTNKKFNGDIFINDRKFGVEVYYNTNYTFKVLFTEKTDLPKTIHGQKLQLKVQNSIAEFGPFVFHLETNQANQPEGYLVFTDDLYDLDIFFQNESIVDLEKQADNLELVLSQKNTITDAFKSFTGDLIYDITSFKQYYDEIEETLKNEDTAHKKTIIETILNKEKDRFLSFLDSKFNELKKIIENFDKAQHKPHGSYLRKQMWEFMMHSEFIARTNLKPRGYQGDSAMMIMIYKNQFVGNSIFTKLLNKFPLECDAASAVRNRRFMVPKILNEHYENVKQHDNNKLNILSVACGPAFELQDIFTSKEATEHFHCSLLDQDEEAIAEATENIRRIEKKIKTKVNYTFIKDSVRTMLHTKDLRAKWGSFDFIYSMGLFDYLTPPVAKVVIEKLYQLLNPGGRLLIGNYNVNNNSRWMMEYMLDWPLYYRQEDEFKELLRDTNAENIAVSFEEQGVQMFLSANKPI